MSNIIRTGLLSFGMSGKVFHAPFLTAHSGFELTAVVERSKQEAHKIYPHINSYASVDAILLDKSIDLIIVNTPTGTHYEFALKALQHKKHVLVEKAFTATSAQAKELFALAKAHNCCLLAYQNRRFDSDYMSVVDVVKSGKLGSIVEAHFRFDRYKHEIGPKAKEIPGEGSGLSYDLGPHLLDEVIALFGKPLSWNKTLGMYRPNTKVNDFMHVHLTYPKALQVFVTTSLLVANEQAAYVIHGTKGSYVKYRTDQQEAQLLEGIGVEDANYGNEKENQEGVLTTMDENNVKTVIKVPSKKGNYMEVFNAVYATIMEQKPYIVTEQHIIYQLEILED